MILPDQIETVLCALTEQTSLYFIPSFQRPYSWDEKQITDLRHDMKKAFDHDHRHHHDHYLAALHFLRYDPANEERSLAPFAIHARAVLQHGIQNGQLVTAAGPVTVYAVVDGQQRLTTLFLLAHIYYHHRHQQNAQYNRRLFEVQPLVGDAIPRLIQGDPDDHQFIMQIVEHIWNPALPLPNHHNAAQDRMLRSFKIMQEWVDEPDSAWVEFLILPNFKALRVLLEPAVGLTAFMTLNDRGKDLTILEKLKALLLQFVYDAFRAGVPYAAPLIDNLHAVFGHLYRIVDRGIHTGLFSKKNADDEVVKLISCYIRLDIDGAAIWQGADQAYDVFFRDGLQDAAVANIPAIVAPWCEGIRELADQLAHLLDCIDGTVYGAVPSLHFNGFLLKDDYHATVISLGLQPHLLALLLRFRAQFDVEWHQRVPVQRNPFPFTPIHNLLDDVAARAQGIDPPPPQALLDYITYLRDTECTPRPEISMIEVVERMQLANWNMGHRWLAGFCDTARRMGNLPTAKDGIQIWLGWCNCEGFISNILDSSNDANIRYLLKEMERERTAQHNLHATGLPANISSNDRIALEHIFSQNIDAPNNPGFPFPGFPAYGISNSMEFLKEVLWRSGNFTWLSEAGNAYLRNAIPETKAAHYQQCPGHPAGGADNVCSDIFITQEAGNVMVQFGLHQPSFRFYIEARCAELALFAVKRFC
jgi:hypothetical protein